MMVFGVFLIAFAVWLVAVRVTDGVREFEGIKNELKRSNDLFEKQINQN